MALSPVISHQQLAMSYSPQALAFFDLTLSGDLNPLGPLLFWSLYFSAKPGPQVPTRAAYSHSAEVGRRTFLPCLFERVSQHFSMSLNVGFCTGRSGSLTRLGFLPIAASYISCVTGISAM